MTWARKTAWNVLTQLETTQQDPRWILQSFFSTSKNLPEREYALASNLVFSVLRRQAGLDWLLDRVSRIPLRKCAIPVRTALRLGAVQLCVLDRIPDHAAVNETVNLLKGSQPKWVVGFVNGVLRSLSREWETHWAALDEEPLSVQLSIRYSHPEWLVRRWIERMGSEETLKTLKADNLEPPRTIRVNPMHTDRTSMRRALEAGGVSARETRFSPDGLVLQKLEGPIERLGPWESGGIDIQDEGAQLVGYLAAPVPGARVLDVCAGRGGKTGHMAQLMGDRGEIVALDSSPDKVRLLCDNVHRQRVRCVVPVKGDVTLLRPDELGGLFALVLVDAPCSALGVLRRRPDARWKKRESDIARMSGVQRDILLAAARFVEPGGALVYCTCSTEPEENESNVQWFLETHPGFRLEPATAVLPSEARSPAGPDGLFRCRTAVHDTDGFFGARFRLRGEK
ncbi:MAG: 16S rRNA (cytosine(967)-C(5))-methyltransferase RsmB [Deltaproteobacteria bacterium]|nr:16S rRNA (cytosine(967)-C(5))-methyltransferase RsmB [Deltaproteobacteria bacterium]